MSVNYDYLSGIIDGEGYIGINKMHNGQFHQRMNITNTDLHLLQEIQKFTNGTIYSRQFNTNNKLVHNLRIPTKFNTLKLKLISKSRQLRIYEFVKFINTLHRGKSNPRTEVETQILENCKMCIHALNHRGKNFVS